MYGFVYMTTNKINNMKYIGKCEYSRKNGWKNYLGSGTYFKRALATYGREAFTREILAEAAYVLFYILRKTGMQQKDDALIFSWKIYLNLKNKAPFVIINGQEGCYGIN